MYLAYLKYILRHKFYVAVEGLKLNVPIWICIFHDWDKFLPRNFRAYAQHFFNPDGTYKLVRKSEYYEASKVDDIAFSYGWLFHQNHNPHHWQYWCLINDNGTLRVLEMPDLSRREMLADWRGAGRASGFPDTKAWYIRNRERIQFGKETRAWVEKQLGVS